MLRPCCIQIVIIHHHFYRKIQFSRMIRSFLPKILSLLFTTRLEFAYSRTIPTFSKRTRKRIPLARFHRKRLINPTMHPTLLPIQFDHCAFLERIFIKDIREGGTSSTSLRATLQTENLYKSQNEFRPLSPVNSTHAENSPLLSPTCAKNFRPS